jgi:hypothetical protein
VTILVCLGLWALLFAPVLERNAQTGPVGARRTLALAVLRPLVALADAVGATGKIDAALRAFGRDPDAPPGGELTLPDFELPPLPPLDAGRDPRPVAGSSPSHTGEHPSSPAGQDPDQDQQAGQVTTALRVPSSDAKLRVVIVGDSLAEGLGPAVARWFDADVSRVLPLGRQSTGLARQDYFNWQLAMRKIETEFRPDLVFVMIGSNDNQAQVTPAGDAVDVGSLEWVQAYEQRTATFLTEATSAGTRVVWVGIPFVQDRARWDFYRRVNDIYHEAARADPLATFVDTWKLFQARDGGYGAFLRNERGALQEMRASDGIHFTPSGYEYLAREAIRAAGDAFDLSQRAVSFRL